MPDAAPHPATARAVRTPGLVGGLLAGILVTSACTHDFSVFDVNAGSARDGSIPSGEDGSFGGGTGSGSGGRGSAAGGRGSAAGGFGGGAGTGGVPSSGGTAGGSSSGGTAGGANSGGQTNAGGAANTGGSPATGGASNTGGSPATGGASATGGAPTTGGRAGTGGAGTLPTCAQKYGTASGYVLCMETAASCRFYANTANSTCAALCTGLRGTCSDQDNDNGVDPCTVGDVTDTCATPRQNAICVCAR